MIVTRRTVGLLGLLLGLLLSLLVVVGGLQVGSARAEAPDQVGVELTSITPTVLAATGELVITGTVTNESPDPWSRVEVRLWRDATPLRTLAAIEAALVSTAPAGAVMESAPTRQSINAGQPLAPDETAAFTVRAELAPGAVEQSWLSEPDAAYRVGVEVYGWSPSEGYLLLGRATSLLAYPGEAPVTTATVVVLNHRPTLLPLEAATGRPQVFADDSLGGELRGRLDTLLRVGEQEGVLTVIDPALFDEVVALSRGYRVQSSDGSQLPGDPRTVALAAEWLRRVEGLNQQKRLARGYYGSVDVVGAATANRSDVVELARLALPGTHPLAGLPLVVVPAGYEIDAAAIGILADSRPWLVLASNVDRTEGLQAEGDVRVLAVVPDLAAAAAGPVQARGRLLSEQLISAREQTVMVSAVGTEEQGLLELETEPWRRRESVATLLDSLPEPGPVAPATTPPAVIAPEVVDATDQVISLLEAWGELLDDEQEGRKQLAGIVSTGWSSTWGRDGTAQAGWLLRASQPAAQILASGAVQLRISDWVTTSADDNLLPVTVTNNAAHSVQVRVRFESDNPLRISVEDSEPFTVQPGESTTIRVRPHTQGNGKVSITAQLTTESGFPIGQPARFVITGTEAGRVAWLIIVASGAVLLVATTMRVRKVRQLRQLHPERGST